VLANTDCVWINEEIALPTFVFIHLMLLNKEVPRQTKSNGWITLRPLEMNCLLLSAEMPRRLQVGKVTVADSLAAIFFCKSHFFVSHATGAHLNLILEKDA
jgi:hypothetical protein